MAVDMSRFVARFLEEAREHLTLLNEALLLLALNPADQETVDALFRSAHTITGSAGMLKLKPIAQTAHHLEEVLASLREGRIHYSPSLAELLSRCAALLLLQLNGADHGMAVESDATLCQALASAAIGEGGAQGSAETPEIMAIS